MKRLGLLFVVLLSACNLSPVYQGVKPQADFWLQVGNEVDRILTSRALAPAVAVDPSGQPIVVWQESPTISYDIYVKRWNNQFNRWDSLGAKLDNSSLQNAVEPDIAVDQVGNPIVVWSEVAGSSYNINVKRWSTGGCCSGGSWQKVGNSLDIELSAKADQPAIATSGNGSPFVTWRESNKIYAKLWDGLSWTDLGQVNKMTLPASLPDIALDTNDTPVIAWLEKGTDNKTDVYLSKWNGSGWDSLASPQDAAQDASEVSLTIDLNGYPVVALILDGNIVVKRLEGGVWQVLGSALDINASNSVFSPSVSTDQTGKIHVAWSELEGTNYNVYAKSWNGSWQPLGVTLDVSVSKKALLPTLATNATGQVFVGWQEHSGALNREDISVKQWKTKSWQPLGDSLDIVARNSLFSISMDLNKTGHPVVAWRESISGGSNLYVKQWNGSHWIQLGSRVNASNNLSISVLRVNRWGHIYIAYVENQKLIVKRWQAGVWQVIGEPIPNVASSDLDLAFTVGGLPAVAYSVYSELFVKRWNGTSWVNWGGQVNKDDNSYAVDFDLAVSDSNQLTVAYMQEYNSLLKVKQLNNTGWASIGSFSVGGDYYNLGFDMSIDQTGRPVIAFQNFGSSNYSTYVKRWDGTGWTSLGTALDVNVWRNTYLPSLAIDTTGNPIVSWYEAVGNEFDGKNLVFAKRWNGSVWTLVGENVYRNPNVGAQMPVIAIKPNNEPVIAWEESENLYVSSY